MFENSVLRELKRVSCNGGNNSFTDVSIIRCSYYVTLKIFEFLNFVAEGYRRKLNHGENFPIYGSLSYLVYKIVKFLFL